MPSPAMLFGIGLLLLGPMLIGLERRTLRRIGRSARPGEPDPKFGMFVRARSFRRLRIGYLIALLGAIVIVGEAIEPRVYPLTYISAWIFVALICVALVRLAAADYIASRRHWGGELQRSADDFARAQAEFRRRQSGDTDRLS